MSTVSTVKRTQVLSITSQNCHSFLKRKMLRNKGGRYVKSKPSLGAKAREVLENIDDSSPTIKMFLEYRKELDDRHDRIEKIVKLSRDLTIENKRIIFLLHSTNTDREGKKEQVLQEAVDRLKQQTVLHFKQIAIILKGLDQYHYQRAYTSGLQEYVEAVTFLSYLKDEKLDTWENINAGFQYSEEDTNFNLLFPPVDYILGIADFTGELMRKCINNIGCGNVNDCYKLTNTVKDIYAGFLALPNTGNREFGRKTYVLKQSLLKMELVCYNLQIRGSEVPKDMIMTAIESDEVNNEDDEGFY